MASAWGKSWGLSWGVSWGSVDVPAVESIVSLGGPRKSIRLPDAMIDMQRAGEINRNDVLLLLVASVATQVLQVSPRPQ